MGSTKSPTPRTSKYALSRQIPIIEVKFARNRYALTRANAIRH